MKTYRNIYFIGIGGIGMSAIARYYNARGFKVSGYDKTPSPLTHALEQEGIEVHYEDNISFIPKDTESTLVVYTPAIPKDMGELVYVQENGYRVIKRSRMLGEISAGQRCMAVAGTHGKTTTSTLVSHIFTATGEGCSAFLGGISKNYGTNLLIHENDVVVAEADEFDRSFLQLFPETAVITSMDPDHLDIYGDEAHIREAFKAFASQVSGTVIAKYGLDITPADTKARIMTYSYDDPAADFHAVLTDGDGTGFTHFDLHYPGGVIRDCVVGIPGWVNIENAVGAAAIGLTYGLDPEKIREALYVPSKCKVQQLDPTAVKSLKVAVIRTEGMYEKGDLENLGRIFKETGRKIYWLESEFACPLIIRVYMDNAENLDEAWFEEIVEKEYDFVEMEENVSRISTSEYIRNGFKPYKVEIRSRVEKFGSWPQHYFETSDLRYDEAGPAMPFLSNYLSQQEGILGIYFNLNEDLVPTIKVRYVEPMTEEKLRDILSRDSWTISSQGEMKEIKAKIKL